MQQKLENEVVAYEAPAIESVITSDEMEREVHYAGPAQVSQPTQEPSQ